MFSPQLRPENWSLICYHLLDRKDLQHVLVYPQGHISQLMYVNISRQNMGDDVGYVTQSADQPQNTAVSWVCALSGSGGSVGV